MSTNLLREKSHPQNTSHQPHSIRKRSHCQNTNHQPQVRERSHHHMIITLDAFYWSLLPLMANLLQREKSHHQNTSHQPHMTRRRNHSQNTSHQRVKERSHHQSTSHPTNPQLPTKCIAKSLEIRATAYVSYLLSRCIELCSCYALVLVFVVICSVAYLY